MAKKKASRDKQYNQSAGKRRKRNQHQQAQQKNINK